MTRFCARGATRSVPRALLYFQVADKGSDAVFPMGAFSVHHTGLSDVVVAIAWTTLEEAE